MAQDSVPKNQIKSRNTIEQREHEDDAAARRCVLVDLSGEFHGTVGNPVAVTAAAWPLPDGAATAANQVTMISALEGLDLNTDEIEALLTSLVSKDFATQTTLALIKAKTDNLDAALSTLAKDSSVDGLEALLGTSNTNTGASAVSLSSIDGKLTAPLATRNTEGTVQTHDFAGSDTWDYMFPEGATFIAFSIPEFSGSVTAKYIMPDSTVGALTYIWQDNAFGWTPVSGGAAGAKLSVVERAGALGIRFTEILALPVTLSYVSHYSPTPIPRRSQTSLYNSSGAEMGTTVAPLYAALYSKQAFNDNAPFTENSTDQVVPAGFIYDATAGTALSENDVGIARININRAQVLTIEDGVTRNRYATVSAANALKVDGSAVNQPVIGPVAEGTAAASDAPVKAGGVALSTPFAILAGVATGDMVAGRYDLRGRAVVTSQGGREAINQNNITLSSTTETTLLAAAASTFHDITALFLSNTSTTTVRVDFRDTTGGSVKFSISLAANGGAVVMPPVPINQSAVNTNWTAQLSGAVSSVYIFAQAVRNQ